MRELKFRAWDNVNKRMWTPVWQIDLVLNKIAVGYGEDENNDGQSFWITDYKLMQYTGFSDKHINPIYEGDIVSFEDADWWKDAETRSDYMPETYYIVWEGSGFKMKVIERPEVCDPLEDALWMNYAGVDEEIKIIGNICENPELWN